MKQEIGPSLIRPTASNSRSIPSNPILMTSATNKGFIDTWLGSKVLVLSVKQRL